MQAIFNQIEYVITLVTKLSNEHASILSTYHTKETCNNYICFGFVRLDWVAQNTG